MEGNTTSNPGSSANGLGTLYPVEEDRFISVQNRQICGFIATGKRVAKLAISAKLFPQGSGKRIPFIVEL